nr:collagen alpha-1(I) chain-like [Odocoileus virginianus texanus]
MSITARTRKQHAVRVRILGPQCLSEKAWPRMGTLTLSSLGWGVRSEQGAPHTPAVSMGEATSWPQACPGPGSLQAGRRYRDVIKAPSSRLAVLPGEPDGRRRAGREGVLAAASGGAGINGPSHAAAASARRRSYKLPGRPAPPRREGQGGAALRAPQEGSWAAQFLQSAPLITPSPIKPQRASQLEPRVARTLPGPVQPPAPLVLAAGTLLTPAPLRARVQGPVWGRSYPYHLSGAALKAGVTLRRGPARLRREAPAPGLGPGNQRGVEDPSPAGPRRLPFPTPPAWGPASSGLQACLGAEGPRAEGGPGPRVAFSLLATRGSPGCAPGLQITLEGDEHPSQGDCAFSLETAPGPWTLTQPHHLPPGASPEQGPPGTLWNRSSGVHPGTVTYTPLWTRHTQGPARAQPGLSLRLRCPATSLGSGAAAGRPEAAASLQGFPEGAGAAGRFTPRSEARPRHPVTACRPRPPGLTLGQAPPRERGAHCALPRGRGRAGSFNYRWLGPLSRANPGPRLRAARAGAPSPPARARGPRVLTSCRPQLKRARQGCRCANELRGRWAARQGGAGAGWGRGWLGWGDLGPFPGRGPDSLNVLTCGGGSPHPPLRSQDALSAGQGLGSEGRGGPPREWCWDRWSVQVVPHTWAWDEDVRAAGSGTWLGSAGSWGLDAGAPPPQLCTRREAWGLELGAKGARALTVQALNPGGSRRRRGAARRHGGRTQRLCEKLSRPTHGAPLRLGRVAPGVSAGCASLLYPPSPRGFGSLGSCGPGRAVGTGGPVQHEPTRRGLSARGLVVSLGPQARLMGRPELSLLPRPAADRGGRAQKLKGKGPSHPGQVSAPGKRPSGNPSPAPLSVARLAVPRDGTLVPSPSQGDLSQIRAGASPGGPATTSRHSGQTVPGGDHDGPACPLPARPVPSCGPHLGPALTAPALATRVPASETPARLGLAWEAPSEHTARGLPPSRHCPALSSCSPPPNVPSSSGQTPARGFRDTGFQLDPRSPLGLAAPPPTHPGQPHGPESRALWRTRSQKLRSRLESSQPQPGGHSLMDEWTLGRQPRPALLPLRSAGLAADPDAS